jgi:mRNA interferase HigB
VLIENEAVLRDFAKKHPEARSALIRWSAVTKLSNWRNLADLRGTFRSANQVCECTVFNISGNNNRLVTRINYGKQVVSIYHFLTHKEYDRGRWKKDCDC